MTIYFNLLQQWCDSLVRLQEREIRVPGLFGGILCPACSRIHGRCADAVYPLLCLAKLTGQGRYVDAAIDLLAWSDNVTLPDGSWTNDPIGHEWKGITVFSSIALAEALRHHGDLLDAATKARWTERLRRAVEFLYGYMNMTFTVINYPATCSAALALAGEIFAEPRYTARGRELAHLVLPFFTKPSFLLGGEGRPIDAVTAKGCSPVDLAYNVEESLPSLAQYGTITGDEEVLSAVTKSLQSHLDFMLPDGAWDDSWATRQFKWTYWGSRTSDGCQLAMALLADRDPRFAEAAHRNTELMKRCTSDGILNGGPHYTARGEKPCIHHTFCHAKAMAWAIDYGLADRPISRVALPREQAAGVKHFPEIATHLIAIGPWRATVTDYDFAYVRGGHPTGGALSMLWHSEAGPIVAASMTEQSMPELTNMQVDFRRETVCTTPRIEWRTPSGTHTNITDLSTQITASARGTGVVVEASGCLSNLDGERGKPAFNVEYSFEESAVRISVRVDPTDGESVFVLPVICAQPDKAQLSGNRLIVPAEKGSIVVTVEQGGPARLSRGFNHVPGFAAAVLELPLAQGVAAVSIAITS